MRDEDDSESEEEEEEAPPALGAADSVRLTTHPALQNFMELIFFSVSAQFPSMPEIDACAVLLWSRNPERLLVKPLCALYPAGHSKTCVRPVKHYDCLV